MASSRSDRIRAVIVQLNSIDVGNLGQIQSKLEAAAGELEELGEHDLGKTVHEARTRLVRGDIPDFRRLVAQVVSRLGHLR